MAGWILKNIAWKCLNSDDECHEILARMNSYLQSKESLPELLC